MSTLATKVTTTALAMTVASVTAAGPALADDGGTVVRNQALTTAVQHGSAGIALVIGVVLLSKAVGAYRRGVWRRHWIQLHTMTTSAAPGWSSSHLSGRAVRPSISTLVGSMPRSATQL